MRYALAVLLLITCAFKFAIAQGEAGVPFLLISPSVEANGMGGMSVAQVIADPTAVEFNPAQAGMFSLDNIAAVSTYAPRSAWLPEFQVPGLDFGSTAYSVGIPLHTLFQLPFKLGIGVSSSNTRLNLGTFTVTTEVGNDEASYTGYENSDTHTLSVAFADIVQVGFGYTWKSVKSVLAPFDVQGQGREGVAYASMGDFGGIAVIPLADLYTHFSGNNLSFMQGIKPIFDLTAGYSYSNISDSLLSYEDASNGDALPRKAAMGLSGELGFTKSTSWGKWKLATVTVGHEAEEVLAMIHPAIDSISNPVPYYVSAPGDIGIGRNVLLGEGGANVALRKGWALNVGEFVTIRGGSYAGPGLEYSTSGYGFALAGLVKLFTVGSQPEEGSRAWLFIREHLDLRYDHASESNASSPRNGTTYSSLTLLMR